MTAAPFALAALLRPALTLFLLLSLLTGLVYPLAVTGVAQLALPHQAQGSLLRDAQGQVIGSTLIGQTFTSPRYFWSRPSATGETPYDGANSGGSNLAPSNPALRDAVAARVAALRQADPQQQAPVPVDLVTASGSGLDPHISLAAAQYQVGRVARARGWPEARVRSLLDAHTDTPRLGFFGEPRVPVLSLNRALDAAAQP